MNDKKCEHRDGTGAATKGDLRNFYAGDECPSCGCTLGTDGYWYIDRDQAPGYPFDK